MFKKSFCFLIFFLIAQLVLVVSLISELRRDYSDGYETQNVFIEGIYLSGYTTASQRFYTILDSASTAGINNVVFDLKNMEGTIFTYITPDEKLFEHNYSPVVNVSRVLKELKSRNMKATTRLVMFYNRYIAQNDSIYRPQRSDGSAWQESPRGKPSWLDPSHPRVQDDLLYIIEEVAKMGVDEIQLDYVRFPTQGRLSEAIFYFQIEDSLMMERDSTYVGRTKCDVIADFVKRAKDICSKYRVILTGDIFAIVSWQRSVDVANTGQDLGKITKYFDIIHPMIYSSHFDRNFNHREDVYNEPYQIVFRGTYLTQRYSRRDCLIVPYIQANNWRVNYKPEYITAQIAAVKDAGAQGYILWNAQNNYFHTLRWIREYKERLAQEEHE